MVVPDSGRKRALVIVDIQPAFAKNREIIPGVQEVIRKVPYDCYIESVFWCGEDSLWAKQAKDSVVPRGEDTVAEVKTLLAGKDSIFLNKSTKSVFGGDIDLDRELRARGIQELHFVGYDTDDCILTSAEDAFDKGYFNYVLEECCFSSSGPALHEHALAILRNVCLTNNSCVEDVPKLQIG